MDPTRLLPIVAVLSLVSVEYGGWALLGFLTGRGALGAFREQFFRAGHAHAGVLLVLSLVYFLYLDRAGYSTGMQWLAGVLLLVGIVAQSGGFFVHLWGWGGESTVIRDRLDPNRCAWARGGAGHLGSWVDQDRLITSGTLQRHLRRTRARCCTRDQQFLPVEWALADGSAPLRRRNMTKATEGVNAGPDLHYSDGIAAARTMIALEGNAAALQRRLPGGWELAPYAGDDLRGAALRGANMLVPFHEVYAVRTHQGQTAGLPQLSYIAFVSQARNQATGALGHVHWFTYTEDPAGVPGRYGDGTLAGITRSQTFTKRHRGQTQVRESFSAVAGSGQVHLSLAYQQGGGMVTWATAKEPNLALYAASDPTVVRWYQEDQVLDVVRSDPLGVNSVSEISLNVQGELADVFDGNERVVAVVIQRPYMRQVYVP